MYMGWLYLALLELLYKLQGLFLTPSQDFTSKLPEYEAAFTIACKYFPTNTCSVQVIHLSAPITFLSKATTGQRLVKRAGLSLPAECRGNVPNTDPSQEGGFGEPLLHPLLLERWSPVQQERSAGKGER